MNPKITWKNGRYGMIYGFVAKQRFFDIDSGCGSMKVTFNIGTKPKILANEYREIEDAKLAARNIFKIFLDQIEYEE